MYELMYGVKVFMTDLPAVFDEGIQAKVVEYKYKHQRRRIPTDNELYLIIANMVEFNAPLSQIAIESGVPASQVRNVSRYFYPNGYKVKRNYMMIGEEKAKELVEQLKVNSRRDVAAKAQIPPHLLVKLLQYHGLEDPRVGLRIKQKQDKAREIEERDTLLDMYLSKITNGTALFELPEALAKMCKMTVTEVNSHIRQSKFHNDYVALLRENTESFDIPVEKSLVQKMIEASIKANPNAKVTYDFIRSKPPTQYS